MKTLLALPMLAAVALYAYTVRLPFFLDDGLLFEMIYTEPGRAFSLNTWRGLGSFVYYRPIPFAIWEIQQFLLGGGRFDPFALHLMSVLALGLAGCVTARLMRDLSGSWWAGLGAGLLLVGFPFSYNAVMWVSSQSHSFALLGMALAVYGALHWLDRGAYQALLVSIMGAFLAIFSHETALLLTPLIALWVLLRSGWRHLFTRRMLVLLVLLSLLSAFYLYLYASVYRLRLPFTLYPEFAPGSAALFAQVLVYPVAALVRRAFQTDADTVGLLGLAAVTLLPLLIATRWRSRRLGGIAVYAALWYALMALPTVLLLPTEYVRGSWRLMHIASLGAALMWTAMFAALLKPPRTGWRRVGVAVALVLMAAMVVTSVAFLVQRRGEALRQAVFTWQLQALL
ncbi:MAG: hypothetical protein H7Y11_11035, partial [Armatimonadetes bacterium]|nr:hypothetical protein [Anaerolineae bacterium]